MQTVPKTLVFEIEFLAPNLTTESCYYVDGQTKPKCSTTHRLTQMATTTSSENFSDDNDYIWYLPLTELSHSFFFVEATMLNSKNFILRILLEIPHRQQKKSGN